MELREPAVAYGRQKFSVEAIEAQLYIKAINETVPINEIYDGLKMEA